VGELSRHDSQGLVLLWAHQGWPLISVEHAVAGAAPTCVAGCLELWLLASRAGNPAIEG
jgi:hypothetical protein